MATRKVKDAIDISTNEPIYFLGHAKATYMSDGTTVEDSINNIKNNSGGGNSTGSGAYSEVNHGTEDTTFTLTPNIFHVWDEVSSLSITLGEETSGIANEYLFQFTSGAEPTVLTLPDSIIWADDESPVIESGYIYQVSVLKGFATLMKFVKPAILISFKIGNANAIFIAEDGMTWNDFVNSKYNYTVESYGDYFRLFELEDNFVNYFHAGLYSYYNVYHNDIKVLKTDIIINNCVYTSPVDGGPF